MTIIRSTFKRKIDLLKDQNRPLQIKNDVEISNTDKKKKYVPLSKRQDKPDSALWY